MEIWTLRDLGGVDLDGLIRGDSNLLRRPGPASNRWVSGSLSAEYLGRRPGGLPERSLTDAIRRPMLALVDRRKGRRRRKDQTMAATYRIDGDQLVAELAFPISQFRLSGPCSVCKAMAHKAFGKCKGERWFEHTPECKAKQAETCPPTHRNLTWSPSNTIGLRGEISGSAVMDFEHGEVQINEGTRVSWSDGHMSLSVGDRPATTSTQNATTPRGRFGVLRSTQEAEAANRVAPVTVRKASAEPAVRSEPVSDTTDILGAIKGLLHDSEARLMAATRAQTQAMLADAFGGSDDTDSVTEG